MSNFANDDTQVCPWCHGRMVPRGLVRSFREFECEGCHYVFYDLLAAPRATREDYADDADYSDEFLLLQDDYRRILCWQHIHALEFLRSSDPQRSMKILDIGCASGYFVRALLDNGWDAQGIDGNRRAIEAGRVQFKLESRISEGDLEDVEMRGSYDAVCLFDVLEHLARPASMLRSATSIVKPGGLVMISVPNSRMSWRPPLDYPPHHISRFSPEALVAAARENGLTIVRHEEQVSTWDCFRNAMGVALRNRRHPSFRGGEFRSPGAANALRRFANAVAPRVRSIARPVDAVARIAGFRYIGQVLYARVQG